MSGRRSPRSLPLLLACLGLLGCSQSGRAGVSAPAPVRVAGWTALAHVRGVVDLSAAGQRAALAVAGAGRLELLLADGRLRPFAPAYSAPRGLEPYIALSSGRRLRPAHCRFARNSIYALRLNHGDGVTVINVRGGVRKFASLPRRGLENGITFDRTGHFGYRMLVTSSASGHTTVYAIGCRGQVTVLTRDAPRIEGGITVAPATFGRFAGDLIAPDELSGRLYAIAPDGRSRLVALSGVPHGQDIGVESEGFVPARFRDALVADRLTLGNRHPGDDLILRMTHTALAGAGVHPGDLLAVSEGGAKTITVTCATSCRVRYIAAGPSRAHIEGHVVFTPATG
jgi:hypothetical protein